MQLKRKHKFISVQLFILVSLLQWINNTGTLSLIYLVADLMHSATWAFIYK